MGQEICKKCDQYLNVFFSRATRMPEKVLLHWVDTAWEWLVLRVTSINISCTLLNPIKSYLCCPNGWRISWWLRMTQMILGPPKEQKSQNFSKQAVRWISIHWSIDWCNLRVVFWPSTSVADNRGCGCAMAVNTG